MSEKKNLYFTPIIAKAFDNANPMKSMANALKEIIELGKDEEYKDGYEYFTQFVNNGLSANLSDTRVRESLIDKTIAMILSEELNVTGKQRREILDKIKANPTLQKRYEKIFEEYFKHIPLEIVIYSNGEEVDSKIVTKGNEEIIFNKIFPGNYQISLSNGRLLWEGELTNNELIWEDAFSGEKYRMAADTGEGETTPTRTEELIPGEMTMSIYAGLESGRIVINMVN